ncbi:unnamed protein product [Closterium sp. Naga37s-1]|nr:unnamed protein product [Closterium sp. Naga37s-1]
MGPLIDVAKEAVLAAVGEELAAHKEELNELRHMLTVAEQRNGAISAAMEEKRREFISAKTEFIAVKRELIAVKTELFTVNAEVAEHKQSTALQLEEVERRRVAEMREMRGQVEERERELAAVKGELAEVKGEVTAVKGEVTAVKGEVTAVKGEVAEQNHRVLKLDVAFQEALAVSSALAMFHSLFLAQQYAPTFFPLSTALPSPSCTSRTSPWLD